MCTLACSARRKDGHAGPAGLLYSLQGVMLRHRLLTGREGSWPISVLYASQRPAEVEAVQGKYSSISHKTRLCVPCRLTERLKFTFGSGCSGYSVNE